MLIEHGARSLAPKTVGILGGGITGLASAYYIRKKYGPSVHPIIFERTNRVGGWIRSVELENIGTDEHSVIFETGPRSFRPVGLPGLNTLDLIEEIGLDNSVLYVPHNHPAAQNRMLWKDGRLVRMPTDASIMFKATEPFKRALWKCVIQDLFTRRRKAEDDSLYNFVKRRFGADVAEYGIDPLMRGICAGDARKISVKFTMSAWYELEQKYGSVVLGMLMRKLRNERPSVDNFLEIPGYHRIGMSNIASTSVTQQWSIYGLENGTESLVKRLKKWLHDSEGHFTINYQTEVQSLDCESNLATSEEFPVKIHYSETSSNTGGRRIDKVQPVDYVISALPGWDLGRVLRRSKPNHPGFWQIFSTMEGADVICTNVRFRAESSDSEPVLKPEHHGFGFLVPSCEAKKSPEISQLLGIVFDTCAFDQGELNTVLSIMSQPPQENTGISDRAQIKKLVRQYLRFTLGITKEPTDWLISYHKNSITQYNLGHYEKIKAAKDYIKASKMPLYLAGSSFEGVSMNDCIYSARRAVESIPFSEDLCV